MFHIEVGMATLVSIAAGFIMLGMVVEKFAEVDPVTQRVTLLLLGSVTLVAFGTLVLGMHESIDQIRNRSLETSARQLRFLTVAPWVAAAGCAVLAASLVVFVLGISYAQTVTAIGFVLFLGPLLYLQIASRAFPQPV